MSNLSQVELRGDNIVRVGQNVIKCPLKGNSQSLHQSLSKVNVALGLVVCLTVLMGGIYIMTGPQEDMTKWDLNSRRNQTHLMLNTRLVPHSHNMSHHPSVSNQVNTSHSQLPHNDSLSQGLSVNGTLRVRRRVPWKLLLSLEGSLAPLPKMIHDLNTTPRTTTTTTTITPWIQAYNDTHHFQVNYTHRHMVEIPATEVDVTK